MEFNDTWSNETIELVKKSLMKDASTQGFTTDTGLTGIELREYARVLIPALTPFRNSVPRTQAAVGSKQCSWRSLYSTNSLNKRASTAFGGAGAIPTVLEKDFMAAYAKVAQGGRVMKDAETLARGFENVRALSIQTSLIDLMKQEEIELMGGQIFALESVPTPVVASIVASGGTIGSSDNVDVAVAVRTLQGVHDGQSSAVSSTVASGACGGSLNTVNVTVTAVAGAFCYDWYVGAHSGTLYYYKTTTVNKIAITSIPTGGATVTGCSSVGSIPRTDAGVAIATAATCNVDRTADANSFNGLAATLIGDFTSSGLGNYLVKHGTDTPSGATVVSLDGAKFTGTAGTIVEIDSVLATLWNTYKVAPTKIQASANTLKSISDLMVSTGGTIINIPVQGEDVRNAAVGGVVATRYLNKMTLTYITLEAMPWMSDGSVFIVTEKLSFPNSNIANVFEVRTQQEYALFEYATARDATAYGGPRYDYETAAIETFINYFPGANALIQNVGL